MIRTLAALVLSLALVGAASGASPTFPLPLKHSELAGMAQNIEVRPGPVCNPMKDGEFAARFDAGGYHWLEIVSVDGDGSAVILSIRYQPGADLPEFVYRAHSPAKANDTIVIDSVLPFAQAQTFGGPCDLLYAPQA